MTYVFQLHCFVAADHRLCLPEWPGGKPHSRLECLRLTAARYGVSDGTPLGLGYVEGVRNPTRRLWRVKEVARCVTAERHGLEESHVQRILSASPIKVARL